MTPATLAAVRRFPLLGRPRPDCPSLPSRIQEIAGAADTARRKAERGMADAAHTLNKAALIASDCGLPCLARELCWQHINAYRHAGRPLTVLEARHMLEPVLNLARLKIRAEQGDSALQLLTAMHEAVQAQTNLVVDGTALPIAALVGERSEHRELRQWVWLQLVGEGARALALNGRWDDAAQHAHAHKGIGSHLMEGRQAAIIASLLRGDLLAARHHLDGSTPTQPWEQQVASCLRVMCADSADPLSQLHVDAMVDQFIEHTPIPTYASYRARLGLTVVTLSGATNPTTATQVLSRVASEAIESSDGYAARDVLGFQDASAKVDDGQRVQLQRTVNESGLGAGSLAPRLRTALNAATNAATDTLVSSLLSAGKSINVRRRLPTAGKR